VGMSCARRIPGEAVDPPLWVFGYGSLMWRPGFRHRERRPARVEGWARRFWQGSTDHRGVPGAPGRVVTLLPRADAHCWGMAFRIDPGLRARVLAELDHRERGGFERVELEVRFGPDAGARALCYVAGETNANYLGPAPLAAVAEQVRRCRGPSGSNLEYVLELARTLREIGAEDEHVFAVERLALGREPGTSSS
jgi:cation transport protein ChaC